METEAAELRFVRRVLGYALTGNTTIRDALQIFALE
jgi:hypothetical protein